MLFRMLECIFVNSSARGAHGDMDQPAAVPERRTDPRVLWGWRAFDHHGRQADYGPDENPLEILKLRLRRDFRLCAGR